MSNKGVPVETDLQKIADFADRAHGDQMRKYAPERYVVHPIRVMETCQKFTADLPVLAAALLHDVLEDTTTAPEDIYEFLLTVMTPSEANITLALVIELTDVYVKNRYPKLTRRHRKQKELERLQLITPAAQTIKYADVLDNSREIALEDPDFAEVYLHENRALLRKLKEGNQALYILAVQAVEEGIALVTKKKA